MNKAGAILSTAVLLAASSPVNGQIPGNWPVIGWTDPTDCGQAPGICGGGSHIPNAPASFDAFVYINFDGGAYEECALGVTWPADWSVVAELCAGSIVEGTLDNLHDGIRVAFAPCAYAYFPFLHLRVEAPSAGRIKAVPGANAAFGSRPCDHSFEPYYWGEFSGYVDVGDVCGGFPMDYPCDLCTPYYGHTPSGTFDPPSWEVTVTEGEAATIPLHVSGGGQCDNLPECGGGQHYCEPYVLDSQTEWLTIVGNYDDYEARVDATGLAPGIYYDGGEIEGFRCCRAECWPVELTVLPRTTAVNSATWGQIKAVYR